jgi:hypothetical protein
MKPILARGVGAVLVALAAASARSAEEPKDAKRMAWVEVAGDRRGFVRAPSGRRFVPWGFNYDHDETGRLLEDYWETEWPKVVADFGEIKDLRANVVRIHLQVAKFLNGPAEPNERSLERLGRLVALAEQCGLYLDLTGLGCYRKDDIPGWYDTLDESGRWAAQACFWEAVAARCADSPAVFCYDLMNEPIVPDGRRGPEQWLGAPFAGEYFVQFITLDQRGRPRPEIARRWIQTLSAAIRKHDRRHLVTVGLLDRSLDRPGITSGFVPARVAPDLDFLCVHLYPEDARSNEAIETLQGFAVGKPVVIEETFPLRCSLEEFRRFLLESRAFASGWIGFYWGKTLEECRKSSDARDLLTAGWLELFVGERDAMIAR